MKILLFGFIFMSSSAHALLSGSTGTIDPNLQTKLQVNLSGPPELGINYVKPTTSGTCKVEGIGTGPWAGSPCEQLYGPNPIKLSNTASPSPTGSTTLINNNTLAQ